MAVFHPYHFIIPTYLNSELPQAAHGHSRNGTKVIGGHDGTHLGPAHTRHTLPTQQYTIAATINTPHVCNSHACNSTYTQIQDTLSSTCTYIHTCLYFHTSYQRTWAYLTPIPFNSRPHCPPQLYTVHQQFILKTTPYHIFPLNKYTPLPYCFTAFSFSFSLFLSPSLAHTPCPSLCCTRVSWTSC